MQALFYLKTLAVVAAITSFMFHVKHYEQFQHFLSALKFSITFLENNQQTPPHSNFYKIYVDNILINVEKLLKRESRKICLHIFHDRAAGFALVQNLLRFECGEHACMFYIFKPPKLVLAQKLLKRESRKQKNPPCSGRKWIYKSLNYYCCLRRNMKKVTVLPSTPSSIDVLVNAIIPFFIPAS